MEATIFSQIFAPIYRSTRRHKGNILPVRKWEIITVGLIHKSSNFVAWNFGWKGAEKQQYLFHALHQINTVLQDVGKTSQGGVGAW